MEFNTNLNNLFKNFQLQEKYKKFRGASEEDKKNLSLWKDLDITGNGKINASDNTKLNAKKCSMLKIENLFDVNDDGLLNQADVDMFVKSDVNGDGKITEEELNFVSEYKRYMKEAFTKAEADFEMDGLKYVKGELANNVVNGKMYQDGVLANNTIYCKRYTAGVLAQGEVDGVMYKDGVLADGDVDGKMYKDGVLANEVEVNGLMYVNGIAANEIKVNGLMYAEGKIANNIDINGKLYINGILAQGEVDGKMYSKGKLFTGERWISQGNGCSKSKYYYNGEAANGIINGKMYNDGFPVLGVADDGKYYKAGVPSAGKVYTHIKAVVPRGSVATQTFYDENGEEKDKKIQIYYGDHYYYVPMMEGLDPAEITKITGSKKGLGGFISFNVGDKSYRFEVTEQETKSLSLCTPSNSVVKGKLYQNGVLANDTIDGKRYVAGALANGEADGKMYKDGIVVNDTIDGKRYVDGVLAQGEVDEVMYADGVIAQGVVDGKYYESGVPSAGETNVKCGATKYATIYENTKYDKNGEEAEKQYRISYSGSNYYVPMMDGLDPAKITSISQSFRSFETENGLEHLKCLDIHVDNEFSYCVKIESEANKSNVPCAPVNGVHGDTYWVNGHKSKGTNIQFVNDNISDSGYSLGIKTHYDKDGKKEATQELVLRDASGKDYVFPEFSDALPHGCDYNQIKNVERKDNMLVVTVMAPDDEADFYESAVVFNLESVDGNTSNYSISEVLKTGEFDGKIYNLGELANGEVDGKMYRNGIVANDTIDGKLYRNGFFASAVNDTIDGKRYVAGVLANGIVNNTNYANGVPSRGTVNGINYGDNGKVLNGLDSDLYYVNGRVYTGKLNGVEYKDGVEIKSNPTVSPTPTVEPAPTIVPTPTVDNTPTVEPTPTVNSTSTQEPEGSTSIQGSEGSTSTQEPKGSTSTADSTSTGNSSSSESHISVVDGKVYLDGKLADNIEILGKLYINGKIAHAVEVSGLMYSNGEIADEVEVSGLMYSNGEIADEVEVKGQMFKDGKIADNVEVKDKMYVNGIVADRVTVNGKMYSNGEIADEVEVIQKMYVKGIVADKIVVKDKATGQELMYIEGEVADEVEVYGLMYKDGILAHKVKVNDKMYVYGLLASSLIDGVMYKDGIPVNDEVVKYDYSYQDVDKDGNTDLTNYKENIDASGYSYKTWEYTSATDNGYSLKTVTEQYSPDEVYLGKAITTKQFDKNNALVSETIEAYDANEILVNRENLNVEKPESVAKDPKMQLLELLEHSGLMGIKPMHEGLNNLQTLDFFSDIWNKQLSKMLEGLASGSVSSKQFPPFGMLLNSNESELSEYLIFDNETGKIIGIRPDKYSDDKYIWNISYDDNGKISSLSHKNYGVKIDLGSSEIKYSCENKSESFDFTLKLNSDKLFTLKSYSSSKTDSKGNKHSLNFEVDENLNLKSYEERTYNSEDDVVKESYYDNSSKMIKEKVEADDGYTVEEKWYAVSGNLFSNEKILTYEYMFYKRPSRGCTTEQYSYYYPSDSNVTKYSKIIDSYESGTIETIQSKTFNNGDYKEWNVCKYADGSVSYDAVVVEDGHHYDITYAPKGNGTDEWCTVVSCREDDNLVSSCSVVSGADLVTFESYKEDIDKVAERLKPRQLNCIKDTIDVIKNDASKNGFFDWCVTDDDYREATIAYNALRSSWYWSHDGWDGFDWYIHTNYPPTKEIEMVEGDYAKVMAMDNREFLEKYYSNEWTTWEPGTFSFPEDYICEPYTKDGCYEGNIIASFDADDNISDLEFESVQETKLIKTDTPTSETTEADAATITAREQKLGNLLTKYSAWLEETYPVRPLDGGTYASREFWMQVPDNQKKIQEGKNEFMSFIENVKSLPEEEYNKYYSAVFGDSNSELKTPSLETLKTINSVLNMRKSYNDEQISTIYNQYIDHAKAQNTQTVQKLNEYEDSKGYIKSAISYCVDLVSTGKKDVLKALDMNENDIQTLQILTEQEDYTGFAIKFKAITGVDFDIKKITVANEAYTEYVKLLHAQNVQDAYEEFLKPELAKNNTNYNLDTYSKNPLERVIFGPEYEVINIASPLEQALLKVLGSEETVVEWIKLHREKLFLIEPDLDKYQISPKAEYDFLYAIFLEEFDDAKKLEVNKYMIQEAKKEYETASNAAYGKYAPEEKLSKYISNVANTKLVLDIAFAVLVDKIGIAAKLAGVYDVVKAKQALTIVEAAKLAAAEGVIFGSTEAVVDFIEKRTDNVASSLGSDILDATVTGLINGIMAAGGSMAANYLFPNGVAKIQEYLNTKKLEKLGVLMSEKSNLPEGAIWDRISALNARNLMRQKMGAEMLNFDFDGIAAYTNGRKYHLIEELTYIEGRGAKQFTENEIFQLFGADFGVDFIDFANKYKLFSYKTKAGDVLTLEQIKNCKTTYDKLIAKGVSEIDSLNTAVNFSLPKNYSQSLDDILKSYGVSSKPSVINLDTIPTADRVSALDNLNIGDIIQTNNKMFLKNKNGTYYEWQGMTQQWYDLLFPENSAWVTAQSIGDCYTITPINTMLHTPELRAELLSKIRIIDDHILVNLKSGTVVYDWDAIETIIRSDKLVDGCVGAKLLEVANGKSLLQEVTEPVMLVSSDDIGRIIAKLDEGGSISTTWSELTGMDITTITSTQLYSIDNLTSGVYKYSSTKDIIDTNRILKILTRNDNTCLSFGTFHDITAIPGLRIYPGHVYEVVGHDISNGIVKICEPNRCWDAIDITIEQLNNIAAHLEIVAF